MGRHFVEPFRRFAPPLVPYSHKSPSSSSFTSPKQELKESMADIEPQMEQQEEQEVAVEEVANTEEETAVEEGGAAEGVEKEEDAVEEDTETPVAEETQE